MKRVERIEVRSRYTVGPEPDETTTLGYSAIFQGPLRATEAEAAADQALLEEESAEKRLARVVDAIGDLRSVPVANRTPEAVFQRLFDLRAGELERRSVCSYCVGTGWVGDGSRARPRERCHLWPRCSPEKRTTDVVEMTDQEMRASPLSMQDLRGASRSVHAFWKMRLDPRCHPGVGTRATVYSNGTVEHDCASCGRLVGVLRIAERPEKA